VTVDGVIAQNGLKVTEESDIRIDGMRVTAEEEMVLLAFHKPRGVECTTNRKVKNNIVDYINYDKRIYPIGRLDKDSEGLILMTNQGELVNHILKASNYHEKEYEVTVNRPIDDKFVSQMEHGVRISKTEIRNGRKEVIFDTVTRPCKVRKMGDRSFRIIITQGLNRQIRRMCEACGAKVVTLKRVRIMNLWLGDLKPGEYRKVTETEKLELFQ
jgi:23S rRNA pseudouridine2604 synthase